MRFYTWEKKIYDNENANQENVRTTRSGREIRISSMYREFSGLVKTMAMRKYLQAFLKVTSHQ
jgi:hypothetical protein